MRDTDSDWERIGQEEPYYGVLTHDRFLRKNIDEQALQDFWDTGEADYAHLTTTIQHHLGDFKPHTALDFGCGVGRLTRAMAKRCGSVFGVDVAEGMLIEARKDRLPNIEYVREIPVAKVDWVHSSMVLQHIPPVRGYVLIDDLMARLNPGGVFTLHFPIFKDREYLERITPYFRRGRWDGETLTHMSLEAVAEGTMLMYDYDVSRILMTAIAAGCAHNYLNHSNHGGCHTITLYGRV